MVDDVQIPETMHIEPPVVEEGKRQTIEREGEGGVIETVERPLSKREQDMLDIVANRKHAIAKELHYGEDLADRAREDAGQEALTHERLDVDPEAPGERVEPAAPAKPVEQAKAPQAPEAPQQTQQQLFDINVQGVPYRVTQEQLQQLASIGAVAMEAANRQPQQPQQPQQQPEPQQRQQQPQQQPQAPKAVLSPEESQAIARRLQYGNDQESAAALGDMTNLIAARLQAANPQIDPRRLAEYATQQAMARMQQQNELNFNLQTIGREFPEVFASGRLAQHAALVLHEIRQRDQRIGIQRSDLDSYREACQTLVTDFNLRPPAAPQPDPGPANPTQPSQAGLSVASNRLEAKRAAPRSPQPAQRTLASEDGPRRYPSNSEIVKQMQKSRGQVV